MSIQFQCPGCGKILAVGDENVGQQAKCPHCELVSLVPEASSEVYDAETVGGAGAASDPGVSGSPFGATAPQGMGPSQAGSGSPFDAQSQTMYVPIKSHLVDAIIVTLCCCLPFGIVGIVYAAMCKGQLSVGNYALAQEYSSKANMWNMIGLAIGLTGNILYFGFSAFMAANH